jgi:hypothetical protein
LWAFFGVVVAAALAGGLVGVLVPLPLSAEATAAAPPRANVAVAATAAIFLPIDRTMVLPPVSRSLPLTVP